VIDRLLPPQPAHVLSCGRGVAALGLAILDGDHALDKVGQRLEERGRLALLPPGLTRASLHDDRFGHMLDALFAANLNKVLSALAPAKPWRSTASGRPGCIRTPQRLRSMERMRTSPKQ